MEISWDTGEVARLAVDLSAAPSKVQKRASTVIRKGAFDIERDGKVLAPVDTGFLRSSIGVDIGAGGLSAVIGPTAEYGAYIEFGVPHPYVIRAHDGGFLRFVVDSRVVFAREVTHPASAPRPYMGPAADRNVPMIERALGQTGEESVL